VFESVSKVDNYVKLIGKFQYSCVFLLKKNKNKINKTYEKEYASVMFQLFRKSETLGRPSEH